MPAAQTVHNHRGGFTYGRVRQEEAKSLLSRGNAEGDSEEATRQDRSLSWIVQKAWKISRKEIMKYPSVNEFPGEEDERGARLSESALLSRGLLRERPATGFRTITSFTSARLLLLATGAVSVMLGAGFSVFFMFDYLLVTDKIAPLSDSEDAIGALGLATALAARAGQRRHRSRAGLRARSGLSRGIVAPDRSCAAVCGRSPSSCRANPARPAFEVASTRDARRPGPPICSFSA